jgi:hypothetical protein
MLVAATLSHAVATEEVPVTEVPFDSHDGLIWLPVQARDSPKPLHFLLDSGAGVSVLDLTTARKLGLTLGRQVTVHGVGNTTAGFWPQQLPASVHSVPLPAKLLCVDLNELGKVCECPVDGLLGADFFREYTVQIDFVTRKVRLWPPHRLAGNPNALPLRRQARALLAPIRVDSGPTRWARLDTGCAAALHWVAPGTSVGKGNTQIAVALTRIVVPMTETTVQLGLREFKAVPTQLHKEEIFAGEAGLLGNGLLSQFKSVTVDARSRRLLLE